MKKILLLPKKACKSLKIIWMIFGVALSTLLSILTTTSYCLIGNSINSIFGIILSVLFVTIGILFYIKWEY